MKMNLSKYIAFCGVALMTLASCDSFLDKLPDDRAEVDNGNKITSFLTSAYPTVANTLINELSTDNVTDNGRSYSATILCEDVYRFRDITDESFDSPRHIWNGYYTAVATANQAIAAINEAGAEGLKAQLAEAKLYRAYSMFELATTFCMAYNPEKADEYLGLPYPTEPGVEIIERGTLRELYEKINKDIEEALPDVNDAIYSAPKYHFNMKAAYAFAARFNLYYMNYEKCIKYANMVLGDTPKSLMRVYEPYTAFGYEDIGNRYIMSSEQANLMLVTAGSIAGRCISSLSSPRFAFSSTMASYEVIWSAMPWGSGSTNTTLYVANMLYGPGYVVIFPKMVENFEYSDKVTSTGTPHIVRTAFTGDETILCRAEAYALLGGAENNAKAVADINTWIETHCRESKGTAVRPVLTLADINNFIGELDVAPVTPETSRDRSIRKKFNPQGFTVAEGTQDNLLQFILHLRRIETLHEGLRFMDLKRYGIEFTHPVATEDPVIFKAGDLRGAIQLPNDVLRSGVEANPR